MNVIYRQNWLKDKQPMHSLHIRRDDVQAFAYDHYERFPNDTRRMVGPVRVVHLSDGQQHGITGLGKWVG